MKGRPVLLVVEHAPDMVDAEGFLRRYLEVVLGEREPVEGVSDESLVDERAEQAGADPAA